MDVDDILLMIVLFFVIVLVSIYIHDDRELHTSDEYLKGLNDGYKELNSTKLELREEYKQDVTVGRHSDDYSLVKSTRLYCSGYIDGYEKRRIEELTKGINGEQ